MDERQPKSLVCVTMGLKFNFRQNVWCWAVNYDGSITEEDGKLTADCELDDVEVLFWHPVPKPINV